MRVRVSVRVKREGKWVRVLAMVIASVRVRVVARVIVRPWMRVTIGEVIGREMRGFVM